jgi:hypothetical protein
MTYMTPSRRALPAASPVPSVPVSHSVKSSPTARWDGLFASSIQSQARPSWCSLRAEMLHARVMPPSRPTP